MILIIDNHDSFTYNLHQLVSGIVHDVLVKTSDNITIKDIKLLRPDKIIISPGPKRPENAGISTAIIRRFYKEIPILGVCLGHQCIGSIFGTKIVHAKSVLHGKTSNIKHSGKGLFEGVENPLRVARYHSLALEDCPEGFNVTARSDDGEIMAIQHHDQALYGVQFHPESFMTKHGDLILRNFLSL
jgi:anthranilate synthase component II